MPFTRGKILCFFSSLALFFAAHSLTAQSGNAGTVRGTVTDPCGAVIPSATVHLTNAISGLDRTATTDRLGQFEFPNVPFNPYQITVSAAGFAPVRQNIEIRSVVGSNSNSCSDRGRLANRYRGVNRRPHRKRPDVSHRRRPRHVYQGAAGEPVLLAQFARHAHHSRRFCRLQWPVSWPGRPRLQLFLRRRPVHHRSAKQSLLQPAPVKSIQSIEVISGAPPAEYGDKTSLVIVATTRSGQGITKPTGSISSSYGPLAPLPPASTCPTAAKNGATSSRPTA